MPMTKTHKIIISLVILAILLGGFFLIRKQAQSPANPGTDTSGVATTTSSAATSTTIGGVTITGNGGYTITPVPINDTGTVTPQPIPDLNRLVLSASVSSEAQTRAADKITADQVILKKNPRDLPTWVDLGIYQKMAGDYEGAAISWKYAGRLAPTDFVSRGDLGDLYAHFLHDNAQSELYYKQAIAVAPKQAYLYAQLSEVYLYNFKDTAKAKAILDQGLVAIPNDPVLLHMKADLNK